MQTSSLQIIEAAELENRLQEIKSENEALANTMTEIEDQEKLYKMLPTTNEAIERNRKLISMCKRACAKISTIQKTEDVTEHKMCLHEYNKMVAMEYQKWKMELKVFRNKKHDVHQ